MKKEDFTLDRIDEGNGYQDYWFQVSGDSQKELTNMYMEQSMVEVSKCVYSKIDSIVGVRRLFLFNYDVVASDNDELKTILSELSK